MLASSLFIGVQILYICLTVALWITWQRIPLFQAGSVVPDTKITVVIVVRNEAQHISSLLNSLACQTYPSHLYEVRIVDDFSTDATAALIQNYQAHAPFRLHYIPLATYVTDHLTTGNFKKKGIELAVEQAQGTLIVTTDGDCRVPPKWLHTLAAYHQQTQAQMICGMVTFFSSENTSLGSQIFTHLQTAEFASLIGSGAATLQWNMPTMCNAANLAFTKEAFAQVGGYQNTAATATGDDLFLMHKIDAQFPQKIAFLYSPEAIVSTEPQQTLSGFYYQRKRWASKWRLYTDKRVSILAFFIFLSNLTVIIGLLAASAGILSWLLLGVGLLVRWLIEWGFIYSILRRLRQTPASRWISAVQFLYPFYVIFFGLAVQKKGYKWKGRQLY